DLVADRIGPRRERFRRISLSQGTGPVEFNLKLSAALSAGVSGERADAAEAEADNEVLIADYARTEGVWVLDEAQYWLQDDGTPGAILNAFLKALQIGGLPSAGKLAIIVSTRRPALSGQWNDLTRLVRVQGLERQYGAALLSARGVVESQE